jgi:hypothetical protein
MRSGHFRQGDTQRNHLTKITSAVIFFAQHVSSYVTAIRERDDAFDVPVDYTAAALGECIVADEEVAPDRPDNIECWQEGDVCDVQRP